MQRILLLSFVIPAVTAAGIVFGGRLLAARSVSAARLLVVVALAAACLIGLPATLGMFPGLPPLLAENWMVHLAWSAGILGLVIGLFERPGQRLGGSMLLGLWFLAGFLIWPLSTSLTGSWAPSVQRINDAVLAIGIGAIAVGGASFAAETRRDVTTLLSWGAAILIGAGSLFLSRSAKLSQSDAVLGVIIVAMAFALVRARRSILSAPVGMAVGLLVAFLWLIAVHYAQGSRAATAIAVLALAAPNLVRIKAVASRPPWVGAIISIAAAVALALATLGVVYAANEMGPASDPDSSDSYYD